MESSAAITALAALAHETRLALFRVLVRAGPDGLTAGTLAERLDVAPSTLSHHLALLERAGLTAARRQSRHIFYAVDVAHVRALFRFLIEDCCNGAPELCDLIPSPQPESVRD